MSSRKEFDFIGALNKWLKNMVVHKLLKHEPMKQSYYQLPFCARIDDRRPGGASEAQNAPYQAVCVFDTLVIIGRLKVKIRPILYTWSSKQSLFSTIQIHERSIKKEFFINI
ncbi:unnamed protein product [Brugia pahangi]|uniref:HORMA domain-containing protein n=1 Tax=Brugia pahangi TaxID=6280 RepID=A0A0N4TA25_BRUPA|nr:unnamed protein product [Brugia pahangi]